MLVRAWMANPSTADGLARPATHVAITEPCLVDLGSKRIERLYDQLSGRFVELEVVDDVSCGGWLPRDLLILEP